MSKAFFDQKSFEIAHAVFRVAALVHQPRLRRALEDAAIELYLGESLEPLERLIRLGEAVGEIKVINAAVLYRELGNLNAAIRSPYERSREAGQCGLPTGDPAKRDNAAKEVSDIEAIFSKPPMIVENAIEEKNPRRERKSDTPHLSHQDRISSEERHTAIANAIRQTGNTAMRDLIAALPDVSERTLRYDLQKLCEQGIIERIGNGGPGLYYRMSAAEKAV